MWSLTGALPTVVKEQNGASIARTKLANASLAPIAKLTYGLATDVNGMFDAEAIAVIPVPTHHPNGTESYEIDVSGQGFDTVTLVSAGHRVYVPAEDVEKPQPGEFVYDPYQQTVTLFDQSHSNQASVLTAGMSVKIRAQSSSTETETGQFQFATDFVAPPYPEWIKRLPAVGEFRWQRGFEEQPSGSLTLEADRRNADRIREYLAVGTMLPFFDLVLVVGSIQEELKPLSEYPQGRISFSFTLVSFWEYYSSRTSKYRGYGTGLARVQGEEVAIDPDCLATKENAQATQGFTGNEGSGTSRTLYTTVHALAAQVGVTLSTPSSHVWKVEYSEDTSATASTNWLTELQARVRYVGGWIYYSDPNQVVVKGLSSGKTWHYGENSFSSVSHSIQGKVKPKPLKKKGNLNNLPDSPEAFSGISETVEGWELKNEDLSLIPAAFYGHMRIDTDLGRQTIKTEKPEETKQQKPTWKRDPDKIITLSTGDLDAGTPPKGLYALKTMDLNHTQSGPTKEVTATTTMNGAVVRIEKVRYGLSYLGRDIEDSEGNLYGVAQLHWGKIAQETTDMIYDDQNSATGYYLGSDTYGWEEKQLLTEDSTNPQTIDLQGSTDPIDAAIAQLYEFVRTPIKGGNRVILNSYRLHYADADEEPPYEEYKVCNPDGTSRIEYVRDPNWVEPMFVIQELTERDSFYFRENPESTNDDPLPPYTTGDETSERRLLKLLPASNTRKLITLGNADVDRYIEYSFHARAGNAGFREIAEDGTFTENEGRPGTANRKPTNWSKSEAEEEETEEEEDPNRKEYRYAMTSYELDKDGNFRTEYTLSSPETGSTSYPYAKTMGEALIAARTDLVIKDMRESIQTSMTVPYNRHIQEGDYLFFTAHGKRYKRRVLGVTNTLVFDGEITPGQPMVVSTGTQLSLGLGTVRVGVVIHKILKPKAAKPPEPEKPATPPGSDPTVLTLGSLTLGFLNRKTFGGTQP